MIEHTNPIHKITLEDIEESKKLRISLINQHDGRHILNNKSIMEVNKVYSDQRPGDITSFQQRRDDMQSHLQSDLKKQIDRKEEAHKHNLKLFKEYNTPEDTEGGMARMAEDPRIANM